MDIPRDRGDRPRPPTGPPRGADTPFTRGSWSFEDPYPRVPETRSKRDSPPRVPLHIELPEDDPPARPEAPRAVADVPKAGESLDKPDVPSFRDRIDQASDSVARTLVLSAVQELAEVAAHLILPAGGLIVRALRVSIDVARALHGINNGDGATVAVSILPIGGGLDIEATITLFRNDHRPLPSIALEVGPDSALPGMRWYGDVNLAAPDAGSAPNPTQAPDFYTDPPARRWAVQIAGHIESATGRGQLAVRSPDGTLTPIAEIEVRRDTDRCACGNPDLTVAADLSRRCGSCEAIVIGRPAKTPPP